VTLCVVAIELIPETVVEERPHWTLVVNRNQNLLGKCMLVLERMCTAVVELEPAEWAALHAEIGRTVRALDRLFQPDQVNLAFLMNLDAQVHLHVIPRYAADREWRGQRFTDPHWGSSFGPEQQVLPTEHLAALASEIRTSLLS
jgi:diadenosine tetraphosphate (Ap4A) HIT family hydrolase